MDKAYILKVIEDIVFDMKIDIEDYPQGGSYYLAHRGRHSEIVSKLNHITKELEKERKTSSSWPDFVDGDLV